MKGLEVIQEQGNDLVSFVHSYRTLLNVPEPDLSLVPAKRLLERVKLLIGQDPAKGQLQIEWKCEPGNLELFIDEKQIAQVLVNLGKNAMQSLQGHDWATSKFLLDWMEAAKNISKYGIMVPVFPQRYWSIPHFFRNGLPE